MSGGFQDFEPTEFPDLTGRSPLGKRSLQGNGIQSRALELSLEDFKPTIAVCKASVNAILLAAWIKVLASYQNERDVCVGAATLQPEVDGRNTADNMSMTTRPVRSRFTTETTNAAVVRHLAQQLKEDIRNDSADRPPNRPQNPDLFDTSMLFSEAAHLPSLPAGQAAFVHVQSIQGGQNFQVSLHFQRSVLLDEDTHHVLSTLEHAILSIVHHVESPFLSWLSETTKSKLAIATRSCEVLPSDHGETAHGSVASHARSRPDDIALDFLEPDGQRTIWTYHQLQKIGTAIADVLISDYGIGLEDSVPVCIPKSPAFYASILGVMIAGGAFTPFSNSPSDRKLFMLEELGSKVVLYVDGEDISWCEKVSKINITSVIKLAHDKQNRKPVSKPSIVAKNLVYQMYTSGSTGRPKAVSLEHGNAVQTVAASKDLVPWNVQSRMLQYAAPSFDMCYYDTFLAWYLGICLCSASDSSVYNDLPGVINTLEVSMLGLTPSVALTLKPQQVPKVEWLYCIGEAMPQSLVDDWHGKLVNSYGPTEAAQMVTLFPVHKETKSSVIGRPFPSSSFSVISPGTNDLAPIFGVGELLIGGQQVAREYFANEEKTKQSFVTRDGERLYRTGDNVRVLGDGNFEFIGRTDDQVKIRGQRVELGEINKAIQESSATIERASSQILKVSEQSKEQLVSFVVRDSTSTDRDDSLRASILSYLSHRLPSYMVPKMVLFLDKIPLSAAGKVDRRTLKAILQQAASSSDASSPEKGSAVTASEATVRAVLAYASHTQPSAIDLDISIYQLGLDSISAIQMASRFKKDGVMLDASDILANPTTRELAKLIDERRCDSSEAKKDEAAFDFAAFDAKHRAAVSKTCEIATSDIAAVRPASALQGGMLSQSIHSSGRMYFNHMTYRFASDLKTANIISAWKAVVDKWEILRSGFAHIEDLKHPFTMITYHKGHMEAPVEIANSKTVSNADEKLQMARTALDNLHLPPWKAVIKEGFMEIAAHHALYDAQVLDLILRDLDLGLRGSSLQKPPTLESQLARTLATFSEHSPAAKFWSEIGEKAFVTRFPLLTPLKVQSENFSQVTFTCQLGRERLEAGCRKHGITMQVAGQAAWGRLISAYTGEHEVTFGTVLSGRVAADSDEIGFPCITTVPTAVHAGRRKCDSFADLMAYNVGVQRNQFVPLKQIERLTGHPKEALFDTIFTYQKRSVSLDADSKFTFIENDLTIDFPISIELEPVENDKLELRLYHRLDKVPTEHAQLMIEQLNTLLCDAVAENEDWQSANVESADQRLFSITPPQFDFLGHEAKLLHEFVSMSTRDSPQKTALEFVYDIPDEGSIEKKSWTYEQLATESNKIAHLLQSKGVKQGSVVAVCFDKCPEAAFTMLAISKLGCSFLALDATAPAERKKFIMDDSKASALVTSGIAVQGLESQLAAPVVNLDQIDASRFPSHEVPLDRDIDPQELSYCLYTSGTTGTPKGCAITHENVVQAFLSFHKLYRWNDHSRWLQFASYHFDVSVMEHFWSWSVGMTVVVASRDLVFADLAGTIKKLEITHTDLTPSLARLLDPEDVPSLAGGVFVTGGEMLRQEVIDKFGPHGAIHNAYGPTEATIGCTMYPGVPQDGKPSNIGWHFPVAGSFIVNPQDPTQPVLRGAVGEFVVSGKLVAQGYIGRPDLTKERFIVMNGQRCYRTGDLVRILHNDTFDFVGRADDQVKLRGQRLEIGEINSVIKARDESVVDVTTQVLKHPKQQKEQLVTFVVVSKGNSKSPEPSQVISHDPPRNLLSNLRRACQEKLPQYMIPTHILPVNRLPLSANNKADAKQLKALYESTSTDILQSLSHVDQSEADNQSSTPEQKIIIQVLSNLLDLPQDQISASVSFFELGLDSISVIGLARRLRAQGLLNVSNASIMKHSTPARLAGALAGETEFRSLTNDGSINAAKQRILACQHRYKGHVAAALSTSQENIESLAPCTPLQQGIISRALKSGNQMYYGAFHFDLKPTIDIIRLEKAFQSVTKHVQVLRTKFVSTDDGYVQAVLRNSKLQWTEMKESGSEVDAQLEKQFEDWRGRNNELIGEPLEVVVTRLDSATILSLHIFHACYDGNSLPLLMQSVLRQYHEALPVHYGPNFHDVLPYGPLRELKGAQDFWVEHLRPSAAFSSRQFPSLTSKPSDRPITVSLEVDAIDGLEDRRRRLNVTPQALLQACWGAVLQSEISQPLVQGIIVSGRSIDYEGADMIVGPLFNTIPFFLQLRQDDSWHDVVKRCHDFNTNALPFQHTPLRDIQKWTSHFRANGNGSLFDTLFVFQKSNESPQHPELWNLRQDHSEADYPLALEVEQTGSGSYNFTLVTQSGISNESTSKSLLEKFQRTLQTLVNDVIGPVSRSITITDLSKPANEQLVTNGGSNGHTNGHVAKEKNFAWTPQRSLVRDEIAKLAGVGSQEISHNTSIIELGLDSVDAVKLSSRMKRVAGLKITVSTIMRLLVVGKIASIAYEQKQEARPNSRDEKYTDLKTQLVRHAKKSELINLDFEAILPCTPLQEGMIADMVNSELHQYFNHDIVKLRANVNLRDLKNAWQTLVDATPILRTRFVGIEDPAIDCAVAQIIQRPNQLAWTERGISGKGSFDSVMEEVRVEALQNIRTTPPFRLTLLTSYHDSQGIYLMLSISHAMYDGWSLALLHSDVQSAYQQRFVSRPSFEPVLQKIVDSASQESQTYWRQMLQDSRQATLPRRGETNNEIHPTYKGEVECKASADDIQNFCKAQKTTAAAFTQAIWSFVLASRLKQLDVAFAMVLSGRDEEEIDQVLFPTMNTIVARIIIHGSRVEMMHYIQENLTNASEHQHFPLRKALAIAKGKSQSELVNTLFIYQKRPGGIENSEKSLYESVSDSADEGIPVAVEAEVADGRLIWRIAAKDDYLSSEQTQAVLNDLVSTTAEVIEHPQADAVVFEGGKVAVCGLPPFDSIAESTTIDAKHTNSSTDDSQLSHAESQVQTVVALVARLDKSEVKKSSSLLSLGLDSISAIKVSAILRRQGVRITVNELLKAETMSNIAKRIEQLAKTDGITKGSHSPPQEANPQHLEALVEPLLPHALRTSGITSTDIAEALPATPGQILMLSKWQSQGLYLPTLAFEISGVGTADAVCAAWEELVKQTPILRTVFAATGKVEIPILQIVLKSSHQPANLVGDSDSFESAVESLVNLTHDASGHLTPAALFAKLTGDQKAQIKLRLPHALYDGYSIKLIFDQLQYMLRNPTATLQPGSQYRHFLAKTFTGQDERKAFWSQYLANLRPKQLLRLRSSSKRRLHVVKPNSIVQVAKLHAFVREQVITIQSIFLAAYAKIYAKLSDAKADDDIVLGAYVANRNFDGADELDAPTLGFVPLRSKATSNRSLIDIARQLQQDLRDIGQDTRGSVSLHELRQWIDPSFKIDTWVNLILEDDSPTERSEGPSIMFGEDRAEKDEEFDIISQPNYRAQGLFLHGNKAQELYQDSIDIDGTISANSMDIGILGPDGLVDRHLIDRIIGEISASLAALTA